MISRGMELWLARDAFQRIINALDKLGAEAHTLPLVPFVGLQKISFRFWFKR